MARRPMKPKMLRGAAWALFLLPLLAIGCSLAEYPQSTLHPHSDYAQDIQDLLEALTFWTVVIFVLVEGALILAVVKFRNRPGLPEPKHVHGNTLLEVAWTIAPAVILTFVAVPTVLTIFKTQGRAPEGAMKIKVVGHQWWWEFQYPDLGVVTASEMHVPVGKTVMVDIETADVLHSFWFPIVAGKRDAVPARTNNLWFTPDSIGVFPGQCAELCGTSHANMKMKLVVQSQTDFDAWIAGQKAPPAEPDSGSLAWRGKQLYSEQACIGCHTIEGISPGVLGPNLTHVGSRTSLAGAMFENTPEEMTKWIGDAPSRKPGSLMPALGLPAEDVAAIVAYLQSLK